jgi:hypothetical protein
MELAADSGLTVAVYSAEPESRAQEALDLLASWTATPHDALETGHRGGPEPTAVTIETFGRDIPEA